MFFTKVSFAAAIAATYFQGSLSQVSTDCSPLTATCPNDLGLASSFYSVDFTKTKTQPTEWTLANYETVTYGPKGAELTFAKRFDAPSMWTSFKFFFGRIEFVAQAANGKGIVSSLVLLSDVLDEIDWEMIGTGGNNAETNYFGKGVLNYNVAKYVPAANPQNTFHTFALDWSPTSLVWSIDGVAVRTLTASEAGDHFPQTPMKASLSLWDGGDPDKPKGTTDWAGGITPIPPPENYTMYVKSVKIWNANPAKQYQYTDKTGSWKSIKSLNDTVSPSLSSSLAKDHSSTSTGNLAATRSPFPTSVTSKSSEISKKSSSSVLGKSSHYNIPASSGVKVSGSIKSTLAPSSSSIHEKTMISTQSVGTTSGSWLSTGASGASSHLPVVPSNGSLSVSHVTASRLIPALWPTIPAQSTQSVVTTEIVYTTVTSCPVTSTITPMSGSPTTKVFTTLSTIKVTSTSTICTRCVPPVKATPMALNSTTHGNASTSWTKPASSSSISSFGVSKTAPSSVYWSPTSSKVANSTIAYGSSTASSATWPQSNSAAASPSVVAESPSASTSSWASASSYSSISSTWLPASSAAASSSSWVATSSTSASSASSSAVPTLPSVVPGAANIGATPAAPSVIGSAANNPVANVPSSDAVGSLPTSSGASSDSDDDDDSYSTSPIASNYNTPIPTIASQPAATMPTWTSLPAAVIPVSNAPVANAPPSPNTVASSPTEPPQPPSPSYAYTSTALTTVLTTIIQPPQSGGSAPSTQTQQTTLLTTLTLQSSSLPAAASSSSIPSPDDNNDEDDADGTTSSSTTLTSTLWSTNTMYLSAKMTGTGTAASSGYAAATGAYGNGTGYTYPTSSSLPFQGGAGALKGGIGSCLAVVVTVVGLFVMI